MEGVACLNRSVNGHVSLSWKKQHLSRQDFINLIGVGDLCACGATALVYALTAAAPAPSERPITKVMVTSPVLRSPPTSVNCPQTFSGTGSIPQGYVLAFGYRFVHSSNWTFIPAARWQRTRWRSPRLYMAQYAGSGRAGHDDSATLSQ